MKKIVYTLILLSLYQAVHAPEEIVNDPTVTTHRSTEDETLSNKFRRAKNAVGSFIGKHVSAVGFGDLHEAQQLLAKPNRTPDESAQLRTSFMNLDAHEKTEALEHARKQRPAEDHEQISSDVFNMLSKHEIITKNNPNSLSDPSVTVHDLTTFKKPLTTAQRQIAVDAIKQYLKDPSNPQLLSNAKKIFEQTEIVSKLTDQEKKDLAPNFFELSKLSKDPQALQKTLLEPIKNSEVVKALVTKAIEQFVDNPQATPEQAAQLLDMYKDTNISDFFNSYFQYPDKPQLTRIQTLIGPDNIIIDCVLPGDNKSTLRRMIVSKNLPRFKNEAQAIAVAKFLSRPDEIKDNRDTIRTILKKSMSPETRAEFMKKFTDKQLDKILNAIKEPGDEIIINKQLVNIKNPAASITTQSPDDLADTVITTLANKTTLSADEETALTNFVTDTYRKNPKQLARIIDKLPAKKADTILGKLSPNIMLIKTADAPVLLDTKTLNLTTSTEQQAKTILSKFADKDKEASRESVQAVQSAIAQHFQKELEITDTKSAQDVCNNLIAQQTQFEPEILRAIFNERELPTDQQQEFFIEQYNNIYSKADNLIRKENALPKTTTNDYGEEEPTSSPYSSDITYLESLGKKFELLIPEANHKP